MKITLINKDYKSLTLFSFSCGSYHRFSSNSNCEKHGVQYNVQYHVKDLPIMYKLRISYYTSIILIHMYSFTHWSCLPPLLFFILMAPFKLNIPSCDLHNDIFILMAPFKLDVPSSDQPMRIRKQIRKNHITSLNSCAN